MKKPLSFLLLLCGACTLQAQSPQTEYTLRSCLLTGIENNLSIQISRNEEQIAAHNATRSNAGMSPTVALSASAGGSLSSSDTHLRSGGTNSTRNSFNSVTDASVDLNWTLFDGFRMQASYARLLELRKQGQLQTELDIEDLVADIATEYYNYVQQQIRMRNYRYAVRLSGERLRIAEERFRVGKGSGLEYQQASVDFNADSSQYIKQHELVESSRINLNRLLNVADVERRFFVRDSIITVNEQLDLRALKEAMEQQNKQLLLAQSGVAVAQSDVKAARADRYPYLRLKAGYGFNGHSYAKGATSSSNAWGPDASLTLGFNLLDRNKSRLQRNAKLQAENATLRQQNLKLSLSADLQNLWQAYQNNLKVLQLERQNLRVAQNNYEIARDRYLLGDLPGIDMREAQKSLLDANERILSAEYATKVCEISLLQISGRVQEYLQ